MIKEYLKSIKAKKNDTETEPTVCVVKNGSGSQVTYCSFKNNCDKRAFCIYDQVNRKYSCKCPSGFVGNGFKCYGKINESAA